MVLLVVLHSNSGLNLGGPRLFFRYIMSRAYISVTPKLSLASTTEIYVPTMYLRILVVAYMSSTIIDIYLAPSLHWGIFAYDDNALNTCIHSKCYIIIPR